ncbi:MAG: hypothetical protein AAGM67_05585 [Bacteroidota bacterium]
MWTNEGVSLPRITMDQYEELMNLRGHRNMSDILLEVPLFLVNVAEKKDKFYSFYHDGTGQIRCRYGRRETKKEGVLILGNGGTHNGISDNNIIDAYQKKLNKGYSSYNHHGAVRVTLTNQEFRKRVSNMPSMFQGADRFIGTTLYAGDKEILEFANIKEAQKVAAFYFLPIIQY